MTTIAVTVRKSSNRIEVEGQIVAPGLAITPYLNDDCTPHEGWLNITHIPSGLRIHGGAFCKGCIPAAVVLADESGVDWTADETTVKADPRAKKAASDLLALQLDACPVGDCDEEEDYYDDDEWDDTDGEGGAL